MILSVMQPYTILHAEPGRDFGDSLPDAVVWKTCLREIAMVPSQRLRRDELMPGDEVFVDDEGFRFLLEVVCGLHSPLIGETEVMGQFKKFVASMHRVNEEFAGVRPWLQRVLSEAKRVRTKHLTRIGAHSYGRLCVRYLKGVSPVLILGSGSLARDMVPSLVDHEIEIHCRKRERASGIVEQYPQVRVCEIGDALRGQEDGGSAGLIVAAPISSQEILSWVARQNRRFVRILDLRGESRTDTLELPGVEVIPLSVIMENLETNQRFLRERVVAAGEEIRALALEFRCRHEIRPFGWEDLCA